MSNLSIKFWSVLLIINLILTGSLLHATVFFDEDFSGGSTPANWDNNALQGSQNWTIQSSPAMASTSGGYYAVFDDYALGASVTPNEAALVTNPLDFSGHTNIKINYEHYWEGVEGTHGYVELSTDGGSTWTTVMDYEKNTRGSLTAPQDTTLDISTYAANESNVKIRFRYNDGGYAGRYWYMDDVTVYSDPDVGITQLVEPAPLNCGESFTASEPLTVRIHNFSHEPVSNVPVILEIQGGLTVTFNETYTGTIPAESYVDFTLSSAVDMSADAAYHFNIQTDLASDAFPSNNAWITGRHQLIQTYPYTENFNTGTGGWIPTGDDPPENDGRKFVWGALPYLNGPEGEGNSYYIEYTSNHTWDYVWIESPVFDFSENTNPVLSFDIKHELDNYSTYSVFRVEYSTDGGSNWDQLGEGPDPLWYNTTDWWTDSENTPVDTWTHVEQELCQLSGYSCVQFRIRGRGYYDDQVKFAVDNISVSAGEADDIEPVAILLPDAEDCSGFTAAEPINILVRNNTCRPLTDIPISIQIDGGTVINEIIPGPVERFDAYVFTASATADLSATGAHTIDVTTNLATDGNTGNDNLSETRINNPINTFPYIADFNGDNQDWASNTETTDRYFEHGEIPYLNGADDEGDSWYIQHNTNHTYDYAWVESPVFDLSAAANPILYLDLKYQLDNYASHSFFRVEYSTDGGSSWDQLGDGSSPNWYNTTNWWTDHENDPIDQWTTYQFPLCDISTESCIKFRIRGRGYHDDQVKFAFDNFKIIDEPEVGVISIIDPDASNSGCLYSTEQQITIEVQNYACAEATNVPVVAEVSGEHNETFTGTVPSIPALSSVTYTFTGDFDMTPMGTYNFTTWTELPGDTQTSNDTVYESIDVLFPKITTYPYLEDFNEGTAYWTASGENPPDNNGRQFVHGTLPYLNGPDGEGDCWYVESTTDHTWDYIWVESPVFDFSENTNPVLSMDIKHMLDNYSSHSVFHVEYSLDGGTNWEQLGEGPDPLWYNTTDWWTDSENTPVDTWTHVEQDLCELSGEDCVKFRIRGRGYYDNQVDFAFDNFEISGGESDDIEPVAISLPDGGDCSGFTNNETVQIIVRNNRCRPLTDIPVSLQIDGGPVINEIIPGPVPRFETYIYTFSATADLSAPGNHTILVTTNLPTDGDNTNDQLTEIRINNPISTLPYHADFNTDNEGWTSNTETTDRYFERGDIPYLEGPEGEGASWFMNNTSNHTFDYAWVESPVFDLSTAANPILFVDLKYQLDNYSTYSIYRVEYSTDGGSSWDQLGDGSDPDWYNTNNWWSDFENNPIDEWTTYQQNLCNLAGESCVKFRIRGRGNHDDQNDFAFDNFKIIDAPDVGVTAIFEPDPGNSGCLYSANQQVSITVQNYSCNDVINVPVEANITGAANANFTGIVDTVPASGTTDFTFSGTFDMTPVGIYDFEAFSSLTGDPYNDNDTANLSIEAEFPLISSYPYLEDFNAGDGYWIPSGDNPPNNNGRQFVHGTLPYLNGPEGEGDCWYVENSTDHTFDYIWVESPVFDFSTLTEPNLSFDIKHRLDNYSTYSVYHVEYSLDGGNNWDQLGDGDDYNWYNTTNWWTDSENDTVNEWLHVQKSLCSLAGESCVKFRVRGRGYYDDQNDFAFDNFRIADQEYDAAITEFITPVQSEEYCTFTNTQTVTVEVFNPFCSDLSDVPVYCNVSGTITESLSGTVDIPAESYATYTFSSAIDLTNVGDYNFTAWVDYSGDVNSENDTIYQTLVVNDTLISTLPYLQDFESGPDYWLLTGDNPPDNDGRNFVVGTLPYLNGPQGHGQSCYVENTTNHTWDKIWAETPVFDLSPATNPILAMEIKHRLDNYGSYSYYKVEYSTDGGENWDQLGTGPDPEWYNTTNYWTDTENNPWDEWRYVEHNLCSLVGETCVKFRIRGRGYHDDQNDFAFDNFTVFDSPNDIALDAVSGCWGSEYFLDVTLTNRDNFCVSPPAINSIDITYSINGGSPVTETLTGLDIQAGETEVVGVPNITIPDESADIVVWTNNPNGNPDQNHLNDTAYTNAGTWPHCNDHCSNAIELTLGTTSATQTSNATTDPTEDPSFSNCGGITLENTVWYYFTTDSVGGEVSVTFENTSCSPSSDGIQVSIDELVGTPCEPTDYVNVFCESPGSESDINWTDTLPPNTTYYITIDGYANNDCDTEITIEGAATPPPTPEVPDVDAMPNPICETDSSEITATSIGAAHIDVYTDSVGGTLLGSTPLWVSPDTTTIYYVEAVSSEGVVHDSARVPVEIMVDTMPDPTITPVSDLCEGDTPITLTATSSGGTWSGASVSGDEFDPVISGDFTVYYDISNGACAATDSTEIHVDSTVLATIDPQGPFCESDAAITLTAADNGG
ncbi:MAG: hypothetical protein ACQES0_07730, partial [Bacteroidota bacterium]